MQTQSLAKSTPLPSEARRAAMITLLADEDPAIYRTVRTAILSCGFEAAEWLQPCTLNSDPILRRRAREIIRYFARQEADVRFLAFCLQHGQEFDLEQAAWLLAATAFPDISIEGYQALLDHYAAELRPRIELCTRAGPVLGAINQYLFQELGFRGSEGMDLQFNHAFLNRVLDRRAGDSFNLCLLYLFLARRLRLPLACVTLPGYFICRYQSSSDEVYVDVFQRGRLLTKADCIQLLLDRAQSLPADGLAPASACHLLTQICDNLHQAYFQLGFPDEATRLQRYLVALRG